MPSEGRDPSGYVTSPPSVIVKVVGTARDDINGLLGLVGSFNMDREQYLVHMTESQSTMALKKENLTRANMIEFCQCQFQQLRNDPRVREKFAYYVSVCRQYVAPMDLSKVIGGIACGWLYLLFRAGIAKTIMFTLLTILLLVMIAPDVFSKASPRVIIKNFPDRAKETLEQQMPVLRGKLTRKMATGVVMLLVTICFQSLLASGTMNQSPLFPSIKPKVDHKALEKYYNLGFEDAQKGLAHGASLKSDQTIISLVDEGVTVELIAKQSIIKKIASVSTLASIFFIYKSVIELGIDQTTNLFSVGQLAANLHHHTEPWRKGLLLLSVYNILRVFL